MTKNQVPPTPFPSFATTPAPDPVSYATKAKFNQDAKAPFTPISPAKSISASSDPEHQNDEQTSEFEFWNPRNAIIESDVDESFSSNSEASLSTDENKNTPVIQLPRDAVNKLHSAFKQITTTLHTALCTHKERIHRKKLIPKDKGFHAFYHSLPDGTDPYDALAKWETLSGRAKRNLRCAAKEAASSSKNQESNDSDDTKPKNRGLKAIDYFTQEKLTLKVYDRAEIAEKWETLPKSEKQRYYNRATRYRTLLSSPSPRPQPAWLPLPPIPSTEKLTGFTIFENQMKDKSLWRSDVKALWHALSKNEKRVYTHRASYLKSLEVLEKKSRLKGKLWKSREELNIPELFLTKVQ